MARYGPTPARTSETMAFSHSSARRLRALSSRSSFRTGPAPSVATLPEEAQEEEEEVDEVEVEGQGADDGIGTHLPLGQGEGHLLQALRVPRREPGEDDHADHRDQELKGRAVPEQPDDGCQHEPDDS